MLKQRVTAHTGGYYECVHIYVAAGVLVDECLKKHKARNELTLKYVCH